MLSIFISHLYMPVNPGEIKASFVRYAESGLLFRNQLESGSERGLKRGLNRTLQEIRPNLKYGTVMSPENSDKGQKWS